MTDTERRPLLAQDQNEEASATVVVPSYTSPVETPDNAVDAATESANPTSEDSSGKPKVRMATILLPLSVGVFLAAMDGTIVASSYASIGSDLKQLQTTSWIATGYMLTLTSVQPLYGKLSDIFGRKGCLLFAYFVFGLGCLACGLARNMTELIAARVFSGIGGGGMTTVVSILVSDLVPLRQRGTWQGILNITFAAGSASGGPLGGLLTDSIGWRWAFLIQVPISLLAFASVLILVNITPRETSSVSIISKLRRIDFLGAFTLVFSVFGLLLGLDRGSNVSWSSPLSYGSLAIAGVLMVAFINIESNPRLAKEPFAPKHIMTNSSLLGSYLTNFFGFAAAMCSTFHVVLYAQAVRGTSAAGAAAILLAPILAGVCGSLVSGIVMQRTGKYKRLTVGAEMSVVSGLSLINVVVALSPAWSLIASCVLNAGGGIAVTTTLIALIANVTSDDQAVATAVSYLFRSLGSVVGISVGSATVQNTLRKYLTSRLSESGQDVDEIVRRVRESLSYIDTLDPSTRAIVRGSYEQALQAAFWVSTAFGAFALLSSLFIREVTLDRPK